MSSPNEMLIHGGDTFTKKKQLIILILCVYVIYIMIDVLLCIVASEG